MDNTNIYTALYQENKELLQSLSPDFLVKLREDAMQHFIQKGFPGKKDESYKYTYLEPYFNNGYNKYLSPKNIQFDVNEIFHCDVPKLDTHVILLVNGFYFDAANPLKTLPGDVIVGSFAQAVKEYPELVAKYLGKYTSGDSFVALNTAFSRDGIFLYVPKGKVVEKPIQVINVLISDEELMVQHRNLVILEPNSQARVVVCDHTLSPNKFLTNAVTEVYLGENATFDHFKVQNEHNDSVQVSHTYFYQDKASSLRTSTITLHGGLVRNNLNIKLDGEGAECHAFGLFVTDQAQHVDNSVFVDHAKPNCTSNQLFKGILDDQSNGAFAGRILVDRDSQKTAAYQRNSNILLSDEAKMDSKPQLEIYADDVKCSHGATVGQLDEDALFYLRARGISEREAKLMLMYAFAYEIIDEIKIEPLHVRMADLIERRLRGDLTRCNNCAVNCG
ncbi:MAG: Fe-S cluster assembly protein SufD [Bacteroidota bacterium]|nr:Fe-S cluster assembly protein SufD [Bacteroidota bacterium]